MTPAERELENAAREYLLATRGKHDATAEEAALAFALDAVSENSGTRAALADLPVPPPVQEAAIPSEVFLVIDPNEGSVEATHLHGDDAEDEAERSNRRLDSDEEPYAVVPFIRATIDAATVERCVEASLRSYDATMGEGRDEAHRLSVLAALAAAGLKAGEE